MPGGLAFRAIIATALLALMIGGAFALRVNPPPLGRSKADDSLARIRGPVLAGG